MKLFLGLRIEFLTFCLLSMGSPRRLQGNKPSQERHDLLNPEPGVSTAVSWQTLCCRAGLSELQTLALPLDPPKSSQEKYLHFSSHQATPSSSALHAPQRTSFFHLINCIRHLWSRFLPCYRLLLE